MASTFLTSSSFLGAATTVGLETTGVTGLARATGFVVSTFLARGVGFSPGLAPFAASLGCSVLFLAANLKAGLKNSIS